MTHPILSIALFLLASLAWGILIAAGLLYIFRPSRVAPTFYRRRKNRDAPERKLFEELKSGVQELEAGRQDEDRVRYQFMGTTGFEE